MEYLAETLSWKYGDVADTDYTGIIAWRHPTIARPDKDQIIRDIEEYKLALPQIREQLSSELLNKKITRQTEETNILNKLNLTNEEFSLLRSMIIDGRT